VGRIVAGNHRRRQNVVPLPGRGGHRLDSAGAAPLPAGLAVDGALIYCAGRDNGLYAKPEPFVTPWQRIGHANEVTGMAAAAGHLFCATRDNSLWMRDPVWQDIPWRQIGHANQVVSMTAMGDELVCATADNQI
jgi:hypothetical protein